MKRCSLKVRVGLYAALLTMLALVAGAAVMFARLYFYQVSEIDELLRGDAKELVWDLKNFRDAPTDPNEPLKESFIPVDVREDYLQIEGPNGRVVYRSPNLNGRNIDLAEGATATMKLGGIKVRVGAWREAPYLVKIGTRLGVVERFQRYLMVGFATALPAVGLVVFFGGLWLGRRAVEPVARLSAAAERISASNPEERLPEAEANDEIAKLTEVLNRTFDRLQSSYEMASRFSGDASHQLKTPLTILRAGLDHLSRGTDLNEAQIAEVSLLRQQTRRLTSLIDDLLLLAQVDAGKMSLDRGELDLKPLLLAAGDDLQTLVEGRGITVEEILPDSLPALADRRLVGMILQSLVENAGKYTNDNGQVRITGSREQRHLSIKIANTGREITGADREQIFERFRRGSAVGGDIRGYGLGLNIAKELTRAHGGELKLNESEAGWIEFEIRLPMSPRELVNPAGKNPADES